MSLSSWDLPLLQSSGLGHAGTEATQNERQQARRRSQQSKPAGLEGDAVTAVKEEPASAAATSEGPSVQLGTSGTGEEGSPPPAAQSSEGTGSAEAHRMQRDGSGDAQTSQQPVVPVVKDSLAAVRGPSKKRIPMQCQVQDLPASLLLLNLLVCLPICPICQGVKDR